MEQHASFKPYRCGHCHYSCNIAGPLKRHYSKKHPNQEYCNAGPGPATSEAVEQQGGVKCPVCDCPVSLGRVKCPISLGRVKGPV
ncbi:zinc finger protein ZFAT-like [Oncorhynchus keta]|uniref:zinc finger protein ZFAT-like n=1 Tax=Oncorhynchus keta TaxID=8018 RepID=UPI00227CE59A|nr:zinc finger protein ZFAT-like [Oncorhynchus keta]